MENKKQNAGRLLKVAVFLSIIFLLFLFFTYLMRNTDYNARQNVLDFYEEDTELDVVFIGASSIYRYWSPMEAWKSEGIATRNYSVSSMHVGTFLPAIKDILRTQNPKLIVVEARRFKVMDTWEITSGTRNMLDSLDYNLSRFQAVKYYCDKMDVPWDEAISLYIDLIQYHDNYDALTNKLNWQLADNRSGNNEIDRQTYKGYSISSELTVFEDPSENLTSETEPVEEICLTFYKEIIEYCQKNEVPLMFLCMPMVITEEECMGLNTLQQVAEDYGVPFVNLNWQYEEMDINFSTDFYDPHHVNVLGADKVAKYLASYMVEEYDLKDHRTDPAYASWHELYEEYLKDVEKARAEVKERIEKEK